MTETQAAPEPLGDRATVMPCIGCSLQDVDPKCPAHGTDAARSTVPDREATEAFDRGEWPEEQDSEEAAAALDGEIDRRLAALASTAPAEAGLSGEGLASNLTRALATIRSRIRSGGLYLSPANRDRLLADVDDIEAALATPEPRKAEGIDVEALAAVLPGALNFYVLPPRLVDDPFWRDRAADILARLAPSADPAGDER